MPVYDGYEAALDDGGLLDLLGTGPVAPAGERAHVERSEPRNPSNWIAVAVMPDGTEVPCNVKDVSKTGARIGMPESVILPEKFRLRILGKDVSCLVRVAWRRGDYAGLRIDSVARTSVIEAPRPAPVAKDVPAPPAAAKPEPVRYMLQKDPRISPQEHAATRARRESAFGRFMRNV